MGCLTDTKVRGFMVTKTNNEACAQLQLVLHALLACAHIQNLGSGLLIRWAVSPKLVHFYRFP